MMSSAVRFELSAPTRSRFDAVPWAIAALGLVMLAWSLSALAGLLGTAVVATVVVLRRAAHRLDAIVADELGPSPGGGPASG